MSTYKNDPRTHVERINPPAPTGSRASKPEPVRKETTVTPKSSAEMPPRVSLTAPPAKPAKT